MAEFKTIETQEQLDAIIGERLKREQATMAKKYEGYVSPEDLEKIKAGVKAEGDKEVAKLNKTISDERAKYADYDKNIAERDAKIKGYETASAKTRIAHEMGLSYDAVNFLQGEDEASIKKSAEALKGLIGSSHGAQPLADPEGDPAGSAQTAALKGMLHSLNGGN